MADRLHNRSRSPVCHRPASPTHSSQNIYEHIDIVEDALRKHIDNEAAALRKLWEDVGQELEIVQHELQKVKEKQQLDHTRADTEMSLLWKSLASARAYMTDMLDMMERRMHRFIDTAWRTWRVRRRRTRTRARHRHHRQRRLTSIAHVTSSLVWV